MSNRSISARALKVSTGLALCTFAIASQADPYILEGYCSVTSIVAGQGKCELAYTLTDSFETPSAVRKALIRVNGIPVHQYVNDSVNPDQFTSVFGSTTVACGASHTVTALIARVGTATTYEPVGSLPTVVCPTAP